MKNSVGWLVIACCMVLLWSVPAWSVDRVRVLALFPDKAMLSIDGRNHLLRKGQKSPEGVELVAADPHKAVVLVDGEEREITLGSTVSANYQAPSKREVRIMRNNRGSYMTPGAINGRAVDFLVDTGASSVALSEVEAQRLGIQYQLTGQPMQVSTASGVAAAHRVMLNRVRVGEIEFRKVEAVIIEGDSPRNALLGMSFLNRVHIENQGNVMVLRKTF